MAMNTGCCSSSLRRWQEREQRSGKNTDVGRQQLQRVAVGRGGRRWRLQRRRGTQRRTSSLPSVR